jgi:hypothetical protein
MTGIRKTHFISSLRNACELKGIPVPKDIDIMSTAQLRKEVIKIKGKLHNGGAGKY